jgi:hypothetical protein
MLLRTFLSYILVCHSEDKPFGDNWNQITQAEYYDTGVGNKYIVSISTKLSISPPNSHSNIKSIPAPLYNRDEIFCLGIKKHATLFPALKDAKNHHIIQRSLLTQATAQAVSEDLDENYPSTSSDQIALF